MATEEKESRMGDAESDADDARPSTSDDDFLHLDDLLRQRTNHLTVCVYLLLCHVHLRQAHVRIRVFAKVYGRYRHVGLACPSNDLHVVLRANRVDFRYANVRVRVRRIPNLVGPDPGDYHFANHAIKRVITSRPEKTIVR